ncbi:MAG: phospho-N-acetylmuramoyl-pentapeptide-transferase [Clostridiales bacterium]|nr:phospho-N-acetylmuramoyl-pentapeptide-transferase [Clostridiales bacterium]
MILIYAGLLSLSLSIVLGFFVIPLLRKIKAGQTVLKYVEEHKEKNGTPTMGGLFFIVPSVIIFTLFGGINGRMALVSMTIGLAFLVVGFLDDFIKVKFKRNEGLKAYQKILFQGAIALVAGVFAYLNGITLFHLPFSNKNIDLGVLTIPFVSVIFIASTNCVNLTDGLDGLAGGTSAIYLIAITILIGIQSKSLGYMYLMVEEYNNLQLLAVCLIGGILAFLVFNVSKARVFMGDTGSLSLGGFIAGISIFSSNSFFIPIIGIMFVLSGISVIVQVLYYKKTKKRVFLMAPLHHHFQLKGYSESKIAYCYALITAVAGAVSVLSYT